MILLTFLLLVCLLTAAYLVKHIYRNVHKYLRCPHTQGRQRQRLISHHGRRKARPSPLELRTLRASNRYGGQDLEAMRFTPSCTYSDDDSDDGDNQLEPIARAACARGYQYSHHRRRYHDRFIPILIDTLVTNTASPRPKFPHHQAHPYHASSSEKDTEQEIDPSLTPFTPARARARRYGAGNIDVGVDHVPLISDYNSHHQLSPTDLSDTHASNTYPSFTQFTTSGNCEASERRMREGSETRANRKAVEVDEGRVSEGRDEWTVVEGAGEEGMGGGKQGVQKEDEEDELGLDKYFFPDGVGIRRYVSTGAGRGWNGEEA